MRSRSTTRTVLVLLFIAGSMLIVVGVLYLITPVDSLPPILGGPHHVGLHPNAYHAKRADVALVLGVITLIVAGWLSRRYVRGLREQGYIRHGSPAFGGRVRTGLDDRPGG